MGATDRAVAWAERQWGHTVGAAVPLRGGFTSTMLGLTATDGSRAVLRLMTKEPWRTHARGLLARESAVQRLLAGTSVPAPATVAADPDGTGAGTPAHLMSWLPGRVDITRRDDDLLRSLARLLLEVHAVDPGQDRPREYQSWAVPAKRVVPPWARRPALWERAFALLDQDPPSYRGAFLHRDFHLGNVLWRDGAVSGLVDWVETSWGPAGLDRAHAATYLAMLHGGEAADRFVRLHRDLAGSGDGDEAQRYWDVMDVVGFLPDPVKVVQPWRDQGRDVGDDLARHRLEERLGSVLGG